MMFGGATSPEAQTETWNGSSWTEVSDLNTGRQDLGGSGSSTPNALAIAGYTTGNVANTESWNGTSWSELADLGTARREPCPGVYSTNTASITFAGFSTAYANITEEWTATPLANFTKTNLGQVYFNSTSNAFKVTAQPVPGGAWASGGDYPSTVVESGGIGSSSSDGLVVNNASGAPNAFKYDGTSWTSAGSMTTWRYARMLGAGSSTAGLMAGGSTSPPALPNASVLTEIYNGSSWTEVNELNTATITNSAGRCGTSTSAIRAGGKYGTPAPQDFGDLNESWDGTSWSEEAELNTGRRSQGGTGTSNTNSFIVGGAVPPNNSTALCEKWDGTSWTETGDTNTARYQNCTSGSTSLALNYGGNLYPSPPPYSALTEAFNGTSWAEVADLATGRQYIQGGGSASSAIAVGGYGPPGAVTAATEEWTVPEANSTITVS